MSKAHTNRRKLIARLKRKHPRNWLAKFVNECKAARKRIEGALIGTLADLFPPGPYSNAQLAKDIVAAEKAVEEELAFD